MHGTDLTLRPIKRLTSPLPVGGIDIGKTRPHRGLWEVEISVMSATADHGPARPWRGFAADRDEARSRAVSAHKSVWPGFGLCVRSVKELAA